MSQAVTGEKDPAREHLERRRWRAQGAEARSEPDIRVHWDSTFPETAEPEAWVRSMGLLCGP